MKKSFLTFFTLLALLIPTQNTFAFAGGILGCGAGAAVGGALSAAHASASLGTISPSGLPVKDVVTNLNTSVIGLNSGIINSNTGAVAAKECVLDGLAFALKQGLITAMTQSIIDWINNGFEGGPSFVTNFSGFLNEIADQTSLDFIQGSELGFLCSPFQLNVRIALAVQRQPFKERIRCSLGDVSDNIEGFLGGDFSQGGWPAWFRLHTDIQNNPFGAYALAASELSARISSRQDAGRWEVTVGGGYFSKKVCRKGSEIKTVDTDNPNAEPTTECLDYDIVTPGAQINDQLTQVLGSGFRQLELADEIDEVINALIAQLAEKALTSVEGITGLSSRSSSSAGRITTTNANGVITTEPASYLEILVNETETSSISTAQSALLNDIDAAIEIEEEFQNVMESLLDGLNATKKTYASIYACYIEIVENPTRFTTISGVTAQEQATIASSTVATTVTPRVVSFSKQLNASYDTVTELLALRTDTRNARTVEALNAAADAYDSLLSSGVVHSNADLFTVATDLVAQQETLTALNTTLRDDLRECSRL